MKQLVFLLIILSFGGVAVAYEEPAYEIVDQRNGYEIRRYDSYIVAETVVEDDFRGAGNKAFRRLFGYISDDNSNAEKIEMTIPVVSSGTAPYAYYFVMPSEYTLATLPEPDDPRVVVREIPGRTVAVLRYSGRSNESNFREHREELLEALERDGVVLDGEPVRAVYNGPFTPSFMRRNEVMVEISRW